MAIINNALAIPRSILPLCLSPTKSVCKINKNLTHYRPIPSNIRPQAPSTTNLNTDMTQIMKKASGNFVPSSLRQIDGTIEKPLHLVRYDNGRKPNRKWWMSVQTANQCQTITNIREVLAIPEHISPELSHVTYAKIPQGTKLKALKGNARGQFGLPGGGRQFYIPEFNPCFIQETRELPRSSDASKLDLSERLKKRKSKA